MAWDDKVKGRIEISNDELDDLVIARPDGTPTYNFCVVVDDIDMAHHARDPRRRPRQQHAVADQHLPRARHAAAGVRATCRSMLNERGREDAQAPRRQASVTQYRDEGYLPEAMLNYLARLGWSHGDDEIFTREQFVAVVRPRPPRPKSPAQWDEAKLRWVNAQHLKA